VSVMATFVTAFNAPDIREWGGIIKLDRPYDQTVTFTEQYDVLIRTWYSKVMSLKLHTI
jgi:hypothetical protein